MFIRKERPLEKTICARCKYYEAACDKGNGYYRYWVPDMCHAKDYPYEQTDYITGAVYRGTCGTDACSRNNYDGNCPDFTPRFECNLVVTPAARLRR